MAKTTAAGARTAVKTFHYDEGYAGADGYVMFSFFSFTNGKLHIGQCQSVAAKDLEAERAALARNGWTPGSYRYVNGKAVFVARTSRAALTKTGGAA
jgi:hypothetical protein